MGQINRAGGRGFGVKLICVWYYFVLKLNVSDGYLLLCTQSWSVYIEKKLETRLVHEFTGMNMNLLVTALFLDDKKGERRSKKRGTAMTKN